MHRPHSPRVRTFLAALLLLIFSRVVSAQTVVDPTTAEFDPSPDHSASFSDGSPVVERYTLAVYAAGASSPVQVINLGKPAPGTDGKIRVRFIDLLTTALVPGALYESRVSAVGLGGSAPSATSNTFSFQPVCSPAISPLNQSVAAAGGAGTITVTVSAGCTWSALSNAPWITVTSGATGSGGGTVNFSVAANSGTSTRSGTVTVAGQTFTVNQSGAACTATLSAPSVSVPAAAGSTSVSVTAPSGCVWTAVSGAGWILVTGGASASGNGTVTLSVGVNTSTSPRSGTVTIAGNPFQVNQEGAAGCSYSITPTTRAAAAGGESGTIAVTAGGGCAWTATSSVPWLTITGAASGTGAGTVTYTVAPNPTTAVRSGTITVGGRVFTLSQAAAVPPRAPTGLRITR